MNKFQIFVIEFILNKIIFTFTKYYYAFLFEEKDFRDGYGIIDYGPYKGCHMIVMTDEEYNDYQEYINNFFIVYENKKALKEDFPEAEPVLETSVTEGSALINGQPFPPIEEIRKNTKSDFKLNGKCSGNDCCEEGHRYVNKREELI